MVGGVTMAAYHYSVDVPSPAVTMAAAAATLTHGMRRSVTLALLGGADLCVAAVDVAGRRSVSAGRPRPSVATQAWRRAQRLLREVAPEERGRMRVRRRGTCAV